MRWFLILFLGHWALTAATLSERLQTVTQTAPVAYRAFWGAKVVDLGTGRTIYESNSEKLFLPASNAKLFSTALALMRLGPDHRFRTVIAAGEEPDAEGVIHGDVRFIGGGDPTLSARKIPYENGRITGNPLGPLEELADRIVARGVRRIEGDLVGDDTAYIWDPYPRGWAHEDATFEYGAPVSALTLHDNSFRLSIIAGKQPGAPGRVILQPPLEYYVIHNHARTVAGGEARIWVDWPLDSNEIHIWGQVKQNAGRAVLLAVRDPARYGAWALGRALQERGVEIRGDVRSQHRWLREVKDPKLGEAPAPFSDVILAERTSPPLFEILQVVDKVSQNLHAELALREVGRVSRNMGSTAAGLAELGDFLAEVGLSKEEYHFEDASGLSRLNMVTPSATVKLLSHMYLSTERDGWLDLLSVGGEDGTLLYRFREEGAKGRVLAKSGTLTGVNALSGYVRTRAGGMLAFSVMVNNFNTRNAPARQFVDAVVGALLEE
jgi:D-alanyl-D-alanine carboxypeptidase/D-alanyl-D-alanine-endopeptidase (penicillin-binding protein 4)